MKRYRGCYHDAVLRIAARIVKILEVEFPDRRRLILANRSAGTSRRHRETCRSVEQLFGPTSPSITGEPFVWTASPEHASKILTRSAASDQLIVVSIGGDGTHNQILSTAIAGELPRLSFARVPLGSGNDSTGIGRIDEYIRGIENGFVERQIPAVLVETRRRRLFAFNIASIGIDAYVTALHDRWRARLPGDTYRFAADLAVLRFENNVGLRESQLSGTDECDTSIDFGHALRNMIVFGVDGHRTYGDHMRVLPGDENVCIIGTAGLFTKIRIKKLFFTGRHTDQPETTMARLKTLRVDYDGSLPLQVDGEAYWIAPEEFPVIFSRIERSVVSIDPMM